MDTYTIRPLKWLDYRKLFNVNCLQACTVNQSLKIYLHDISKRPVRCDLCILEWGNWELLLQNVTIAKAKAWAEDINVREVSKLLKKVKKQ